MSHDYVASALFSHSCLAILCTVFTLSLSCIFIAFAGSMFNESLLSIQYNTTSSLLVVCLFAAIDRLQGNVFETEENPFA